MTLAPPQIPYASPPALRSFISTIVCWSIILLIVGAMLTRTTLAYRTVAAKAIASHSMTSPVTLEVVGRIVVGENELLLRQSAANSDQSAQRLRKQMLGQIDSVAKTPNDKLNTIPIIAELQGVSVAIDRLNQLKSFPADAPDLQTDAHILRSIYTDGPDAVTPADHDALLKRRGWFAELALSFGKTSTDPQRIQAIAPAVRTVTASALVGGMVLLLIFAGILLLITAIVLRALGCLPFNYHPIPSQGPPAFLEIFAIWLAAFNCLGIAIRFLIPGGGLFVLEVTGLVLSFVIALWPLLRGQTWPQLRVNLGWHAGRGLFQEMGLGLIGLIAGLPIIAVGMIVTFVLVSRSHIQPTHPIVFGLGQGGSLGILSLYLAACVGAPLLEETVFRGALYHHLRGRWRPWWSMVVVSFLFAAIHPQGWTTIPALGSIAVVLALLREWRGSLVASATAHATCNAAVLTVLLYLLR